MNLGLVYIVFAQLLWSIEMILIRKFFPNANSLFLSAIGSSLGSIFYLPIFFTFKLKFSITNWIILIIYAFTTWFLAQIFYINGVQKGLSTFSISLATLTLPVFSIILGSIFLKGTVTIKEIIGSIFIIVGFLIISISNR